MATNHVVHKNLPLALTGFSLLLIIIGLISLFVLQPLVLSQRSSTENRSQASVSTGLVTVQGVFQDVSSTDNNAHLGIQLNSQNVQLDSVPLVVHLITPALENVVVTVPSNTGAKASTQELQKVSDGYLLSLKLVPINGTSFSTSQYQTVVQIDFHPDAAGQIVLSFDETNSSAWVHGTTPPRDELKTLPVFTYYTMGTWSASPTPTPSPTATSTPTPTATPVPASCNKSCGSNQDCATNLRCINSVCRLATNTGSDTCAAPPDNGLQRQCNQYCADSRECASGYTCFYNHCRLPSAPDDSLCKAPSVASVQSMGQSCNTACTSNAGCAINLRCYNGACRLATNVSSTSCSAQTVTTVSKVYGQGTFGSGSKGAEVTVPVSSASGSLPYGSASPFPATGSTATFSSGISSSPAPTSVLNNLGSGVLQNIADVIGSSLSMVAIVAGVVLLLLAIVALVIGRGNRRPPTKPPLSGGVTSAQSITPAKPQEQQLAQRIRELQQTPSRTAPVMPATAPTAPAVTPPKAGTVTVTPPSGNAPTPPASSIQTAPGMQNPTPGAQQPS